MGGIAWVPPQPFSCLTPKTLKSGLSRLKGRKVRARESSEFLDEAAVQPWSCPDTSQTLTPQPHPPLSGESRRERGRLTLLEMPSLLRVHPLKASSALGWPEASRMKEAPTLFQGRPLAPLPQGIPDVGGRSAEPRAGVRQGSVKPLCGPSFLQCH